MSNSDKFKEEFLSKENFYNPLTGEQNIEKEYDHVLRFGIDFK